MYDLEKWVYPTLSKFPKSQKTLSQRIEVTSIRILEMIIDLSEKDTRDYRKKILNEIQKLQILFRLCKDLSYLNFRQYEFVSSLLNDVSNLLVSEPKTQDVGELANRGGGFAQEVVLSLQSTVLSSQSYVLHKSLQRDLLIQEFGTRLQESKERQKRQKISPRF